jgi:hypothetical protein
MSESYLITELNTKALVHALTVMKIFHNQINLHQAKMTPIMVMPGVVAAYTLSPWNSTQACGPKKDNKNTLFMVGASRSNLKVNFNSEQGRRDKCNPATPDSNDEKATTRQKQKKPCCAVKVDTASKEKTALGMSYLHNNSINPSDVFLKDMSDKICANFTCKGKECNNMNCDFLHPRRPSELKPETILTIANHFTKRDISWFNEYHFMKMPNIMDEIKKYLGKTPKVPTVRWLDQFVAISQRDKFTDFKTFPQIVFSCY